MSLLPGKVNTFDQETVIYESGDKVDTICFILKGTVKKESSEGTTTIVSGNFLAVEDIYEGFYTSTYHVTKDTEIIPFIADTPKDFVSFLNANPSIQGDLCFYFCRLITDLKAMYCSLYDIMSNFYETVMSQHERYVACCRELLETPETFIFPDDVKNYSFESFSFVKNYEIMAALAKSKSKAEAVYRSNGNKFLMIQNNIINELFTTYDDMVYYLRSMIALFASNSDKCLFALTTELLKKAGNAAAFDRIYSLLTDLKSTITDFDTTIKEETNITIQIDYNRVSFFFMMADELRTHINGSHSSLSSDDLYNSDDNDIDYSFDSDEYDIDYSLDDDGSDVDYSGVYSNGNTDNMYDHEENHDDMYDYMSDESDDDSYNDYDTGEDIDLSGTLRQICNYGHMDSYYDDMNAYMEKFLQLPDKESKDDSVRLFRKNLTQMFYTIYENVAMEYVQSTEPNRLIELFLDFGFLDERLLTDSQLQFLLSIEDLENGIPCMVYRMHSWLKEIYSGRKIPSKNEFDQEYTDYVREQKKNLALSADEEKELLNDNLKKVQYEVRNMLKYNSRLLSGKMLTFFPMLHMDSFERDIENMLLTSDFINDTLTELVSVDYSVFYRETLYSSPENKIDKVSIQKEIYPDIILFPVAGINGVMWQELSGKRSNSKGRFFLPAFYNGTLKDTMLSLLGRFHWELCKSLQGGAWNNIAVPSLTSEYSDYVQFYRKNKELSSEKKEALKNQFTRCRNNVREIFVYDYIIWMKFESAGAIRLNKVSRKILATYCPFSKEIRSKIGSQPIFEEAMKKYNIDKLKKTKEFNNRLRAFERNNATLTQEIFDTQFYYEEL